jgi:flagellar hook-associated protein 2
MQGTISIGGLTSGLQVEDIIQKLGQAERQPILRYQEQQTTLRSQLKAFQEANTRLAAIRDAAGQLADRTFFENRTVTTSKTDVLTAAVEVGAVPGEYQVSVEAIARAHQTMSQSYGSLDAAVSQGTLQISSGGVTTTVTVDASNNTLSGLRDAINSANGSVRAAIIQDGDSSYRLLVSAKETGTAHAITLTNSLAPTGGDSVRPAFTDLQAAQDAQVKLGSGANAITIVRGTNAVRDLIPGVTLNLAAEQPGTPITVTVGQDKSRIQDAVQKLVDQYNNAVDYLNQQFSFNSDKKEGGALLGDFTLKNAQNDVSRVFAGVVAGLGSDLHSLGDVGITFTDNGKLTFNASQFQEKMTSDPTAVMNVFALTGQSTNAGISLVSAGTKTAVNGSSFAVDVTQAARQARITAGTAQSGPLDADETLTLNGKAIALTAGMTQSQVLAAINAKSAETGVVGSATGADGTGTGSFLTFKSLGYGSAGSISVVSSRSSGAGATSGAGNVAATVASPGGETGGGSGEAGLDVAGTINGEPATGKGRLLSGNEGNATTDGLQLHVTLTASALQSGTDGTLQLFDGLANAAQRTLDSLLDSKTGSIQGQEDNLQSRIDYIQKIIDEREEAAQRREDALREQFNAMEVSLTEFQNQSSYLSSQLRSL